MSSDERSKNDRWTQFRAKWVIFRTNRIAFIGLCIFIISILIALFGPYISPYDAYNPVLSIRMMPPSAAHWFGTDSLGRDLATRILFGTRTTLMVACGAVFIASVLGVPIGALSGYFGGKFDAVVMRLIDALMAFPSRLMAIAMVAFMGASIPTLWVAIAVNSLCRYARIIRGEMLAHRELEYVHSARISGEGHFTIIFKEIMPNCLAPLMIQLSLNFADAIIVESSLSYLGLGLSPPTISWGLMLKDGQMLMEMMPWIAIFPGLAIAIFVLGFNLIGDGLRDAFDPRQHKR